MGSVKDLQVVKPASESEAGEGIFVFSDRYSAFDWGEMPDHIPNKGAALCMMAAWNLEQLEALGVKTHYIGLIDEQGKTVKTSELIETRKSSNKMRVKLVRVLPTDNNYAVYRKQNNNYLIPLEIVFRNGLPQGSSVFNKIEKAKKEGRLQDVLASLGLDHEPSPGEMLPKPVFDYWTKLEASDRLLSEAEAKRISGLGDRFSELQEIAEKVNSFVTAQAEKQGFVHYDGKIECVYSNGDILVCDTVGTLDEDRFAFNGLQVSKQLLRNPYLSTKWYEDLEETKKKAKTKEELRALCPSKPVSLPPEFIKLVSQIYQSACNQYTGERVFDVPVLKELMAKLG